MKKYYWTMKNGQKIDIDLMDENHLRNTLKMILRNIERAEAKHEQPKRKRFELNGEIAQDLLDQAYLADSQDYNDYMDNINF